MADPARRLGPTPNAGLDGHIALLLERVCARLPNDYARQVVRGVVRLKLEMGFEGEVREYLERRSGEYAAIPAVGGPKLETL